MENEVLNTMLARSSIRAYTDEALTEEELSVLADAALAAPTAMNKQAQRFYFITDKKLISEWEEAVGTVIEAAAEPEMRERMRERNGKVFYNAPLFIAIAVDKSGKFSMCDSGIAVENIALAAQSIGLSSVILGIPDLAFSGDRADYLRDRLGMEENLSFAIGIAVGHAATDKAPHDTDSTHVIYIKD